MSCSTSNVIFSPCSYFLDFFSVLKFESTIHVWLLIFFHLLFFVLMWIVNLHMLEEIKLYIEHFLVKICKNVHFWSIFLARNHERETFSSTILAHFVWTFCFVQWQPILVFCFNLIQLDKWEYENIQKILFLLACWIQH